MEEERIFNVGMGTARHFHRIDKAQGFTFNPLHGKGGAWGNGVGNSEENGGRELAEYGRCDLDYYDTEWYEWGKGY